jgi:hypothetical protein
MLFIFSTPVLIRHLWQLIKGVRCRLTDAMLADRVFTLPHILTDRYIFIYIGTCWPTVPFRLSTPCRSIPAIIMTGIDWQYWLTDRCVYRLTLVSLYKYVGQKGCWPTLYRSIYTYTSLCVCVCVHLYGFNESFFQLWLCSMSWN